MKKFNIIIVLLTVICFTLLSCSNNISVYEQSEIDYTDFLKKTWVVKDKLDLEDNHKLSSFRILNIDENNNWNLISPEEAQQRANKGFPTIATWKNPSGASGHIVIIVPQKNNDTFISTSQAGATNFEYGSLTEGFGNISNNEGGFYKDGNEIYFYTHD